MGSAGHAVEQPAEAGHQRQPIFFDDTDAGQQRRQVVWNSAAPAKRAMAQESGCRKLGNDLTIVYTRTLTGQALTAIFLGKRPGAAPKLGVPVSPLDGSRPRPRKMDEPSVSARSAPARMMAVLTVAAHCPASGVQVSANRRESISRQVAFRCRRYAVCQTITSIK
jgi:hypothetical protein